MFYKRKITILTALALVVLGTAVLAGEAPNPNAGSGADVDYGPYMAELSLKVRQLYLPPKGHEHDRVIVQFWVHSGGAVSDLRVAQSSGFAPSDEAALKAVQDAAPLRALPSGSNEKVDIKITLTR
jgi:TonB family protein